MSGDRLMVTAELTLAETDWPRFRALLAETAAHDGWLWRDGSGPSALGGSLDREGGAHVAYKQWRWAHPREERATLYVVAPQGGAGWPAAEALLGRLTAEWPLRASGPP